MSKAIDKIIAEIFSPFLLIDDYPKLHKFKPPTFKQIEEFAKLIAQDKSEETFHQFLSRHPHFLFRLAPSTDDTTLAFISKPPISNFNTADFGLLTVSQGGCRLFLIELERPSDRLFTSKLTPAKKLQTAMGQVHDWDQWVRNNRQTFMNTMMRILKDAETSKKKHKSGTHTLCDIERLEGIWNGFGGIEHCTFEYLIVIGRWSKLTIKERERLMYLNSNTEQTNLRIRTYDNLARKVIDGPRYFW
jgi:hypothetical protein